MYIRSKMYTACLWYKEEEFHSKRKCFSYFFSNKTVLLQKNGPINMTQLYGYLFLLVQFAFFFVKNLKQHQNLYNNWFLNTRCIRLKKKKSRKND